jgi:phage terminase small subunit
MSLLNNAKHEHFAHLLAKGETVGTAYVLCGYSGKGALQSGNRLLRLPEVLARVQELKRAASERQTEKTALDRAWVVAKLIENVNRAMQGEPVRDTAGRPTGEYTYQGSVANKALELLGKELGMFQGQPKRGGMDIDILGQMLDEGRQRVAAEKRARDARAAEEKRAEDAGRESIDCDLRSPATVGVTTGGVESGMPVAAKW